MNHELIIELMEQQLAPRLALRKFHVLPAIEQRLSVSQHHEPIFPYKPHSHSFFEWVWCIENHAFLKIEEDVYRLESGDFCLMPPGKMHVATHHPTQQEYKVLSPGKYAK